MKCSIARRADSDSNLSTEVLQACDNCLWSAAYAAFMKAMSNHRPSLSNPIATGTASKPCPIF
jgi:hypothetical protein